ncbi:MAG: excinuclease ABC subunit UvrB [Patescibacteria group bacterium]
MDKFKLISPFKPMGDQPQAINSLVAGLSNNQKHQVLLGVTGSGKTFTMANVIARTSRPTLIISHNKTLAAQLTQEFREFFPENAVEYFVSYYDYYQPEAYVPSRDQYIAKEADINDEIDKLRLSATASLLTRKDVIVVASVSCIYNIGSPLEYGKAVLSLKTGEHLTQSGVLHQLVDLYYERNDVDFHRSTFRVRGESIDIWPSYKDTVLRLVFSPDNKLTALLHLNPLTGTTIEELATEVLYPAKHYVAPKETYTAALQQIKSELKSRLTDLRKRNKLVEAQRLEERTKYDLEMMTSVGYCSGIENYSRYFDGRAPGKAPFSLLDYFPKDFLVFIDESHITVPQIRGMYNGDRSRKETLIEYGFRLPSALDNRPLRFTEFQQKVNQTIYFSATPDSWEISLSGGKVCEQLIRPTGLLDPEIEVRKTTGQIGDLLREINKRVLLKERVLVTTLTKRMGEDLADYLKEKGIKVQYLHADIQTMERSDILDDLRRGNYDVIVGINLLREGLDLPEVSLVIILDADKEGFLRSETSLIQLMGRASRHLNGRVIMYADKTTGSMQRAITEINRRREIQAKWNKKYKIKPLSIIKPIRERLIEKKEEANELDSELRITENNFLKMNSEERLGVVKILEREMRSAAENLDFETAGKYRDQIKELKKNL